MATSRKFYLAGPMSGLPDRNFPAFIAAAEHLRAIGIDVISPAEFEWELPTEGDLPIGHTYGDVLGRDVKIVIDDVVGLILLPGWEKSVGSRIEAFTGLAMNKMFDLYTGHTGREYPLVNVGREYIRARII